MTPDLFGSGVRKDAVISECGLYRYRLRRVWDEAVRPACFLMLNPSTADATEDDPTIRRCVAFARSWGAGGIWVVNLFAYRATDPRALFDVYYRKQTGPGAFHNGDPIGPENDRHLREAVERCRPVVAAWGVQGVMMLRDQNVRQQLAGVGVRVECLGVTKDDHPRHPLYVRGDTPLQPFPTQAQKGA